MKLSKAQQEVVDKMREGSVIYQNTFSGRIWIRKDGVNSDINTNTYMGLRRHKVIAHAGYTDTSTEYFQLTEKYRSNERPNK